VERGIAVYLPRDIEVGVGSWRVRPGAEPQFAQPLGDDATVRRLWSAPAAGLGLQLLVGLSLAGAFHASCWFGEQLRQVVSEVSALEAWWMQADLPYDVLADLREASVCLREAAGIAEECGGSLVIA
jgi:hypothetical protein